MRGASVGIYTYLVVVCGGLGYEVRIVGWLLKLIV